MGLEYGAIAGLILMVATVGIILEHILLRIIVGYMIITKDITIWSGGKE